MDCIEAQSLISEAMDRRPIDPALLAEAKLHCDACPDCGAFVRAQLAAKAAGTPTPPADLADRVMATIRTEDAARRATAEQAAAAAEAAEQAAPEPAGPPPPPATLAPRQPKKMRLPRPWAVGVAAVTMVVGVFGTAAVVMYGVRVLSGPQDTKNYTYTNPSAAQTDRSAGPTLGSAAPQAAEVAAAGPQNITVSGVVYALSGPSSADPNTLSKVGTTNSALGTKAPATAHDVLGSPGGSSADTVYVADDSGALFEFTRVTRTYLGLTYVLTSADLNAYGQWPTLPRDIPKPSTDDGQPTFSFDGTDSAGVKVYRRANSTVSDGIAIAPKSDADGPASGDPYWTWWAPVR